MGLAFVSWRPPHDESNMTRPVMTLMTTQLKSMCTLSGLPNLPLLSTIVNPDVAVKFGDSRAPAYGLVAPSCPHASTYLLVTPQRSMRSPTWFSTAGYAGRGCSG